MENLSINVLFKNIETLSCVSIGNKKLLNTLNIYKIIDLLLYFPYKINKIEYVDNVRSDLVKKNIIVKIKIIDSNFTSSKFKKNFGKIVAIDSLNNIINLNFFHFAESYIKSYLKEKEPFLVSGVLEKNNNDYMINHPRKINPAMLANKKYINVNQYPLTKGLNNDSLVKMMKESLAILEKVEINEWWDEKFLQEYNFKNFKKTIIHLHNTENEKDLELNSNYRTRIALDEMFAYQLAVFAVRSKKEKKIGNVILGNQILTSQLIKNIGFELTNDQRKAILDIELDLKNEYQQIRLLQGDVGSGKTVVMFYSALIAVEACFQVAIMCPTEILAMQHFTFFKNIAEKFNVKIGFLSGKDKGKKRELLIQLLKNGEIDIIIGTHSLFQKDVFFKNLGLVIIDEQHRFGVMQRIHLLEKGSKPHLIIASATPIPRTLSLAMYGDIKITEIKEKPKNRKEIITKTISMGKILDFIAFIKQKILQKEKVFWVCPLVEDSESLNLTSVLTRFETLKEFINSDEIFLVHGKMKALEKNNIMEKFKNARSGILIATVVIEVGIDIPDCNIIVIEDAKQFGLSQLHQLRGRVGRGDLQSFCFLLYDNKLSENAKKRLSIIKKSNDGFFIAEEDFLMRGMGNIIGLEQSGFSFYKNVDLSLHGKYLQLIIKKVKYLFNLAEKNSEYLKIYNNLMNIFNLTENMDVSDIG
jgi:ATP-dependent DNA helicase RecG